jgi:hypothetical protein
MKPRGLIFGKQCAFGAGLVVLLNLLVAGTAFARTADPGDISRQVEAPGPQHGIQVEHNLGWRHRRPRHLADPNPPASQPSLSANAPAGNSSGLQMDFEAFVASVRSGQATVVSGVYVPGVLALRVSLAPGTATQYGPASAYGVTGLLADDASSGVLYYGLANGQEVRLVLGDGSVQTYHVNAVYRYQALSPNDPYSNFKDLNSGELLPAIDLFTRMYSGGKHITFQTCLAQDGLLSWGRLFVIAIPN